MNSPYSFQCNKNYGLRFCCGRKEASTAVIVISFFLLLTGWGQRGALFISPKESGIRFYSINEKNQERELLFLMGTTQPGCHNLPLKQSVYRVAQVGFEFCEVFSEKNCAPGNLHVMKWIGPENDSQVMLPTTKITPGARWLFDGPTEAQLSSWLCQTQ